MFENIIQGFSLVFITTGNKKLKRKATLIFYKMLN